MHPKAKGANDTGGEQGTPGAFDSWTALQKATDRTRANLIADIVGHPKGAPSVKELDYMNPSLEADAIRRHLSILRDVGVVTELEVEPGNRIRGYPYKFYRLSDPARELFDRNDLFPTDAWQRQYARVQRTGEIKDLEAMPRPTVE
ncbi:ArsR family transcriptional regulator [Natrarchaeobius halalkaliphilus]|uniref:ArsR family transcriptional regulator n=1 Tax=Natrarchaeobius halalkaliphilus TaxID=1679091 RepID=A0A3N6LT57_9EURY|nr:ArsR family transcriptional regulator [Natrarchaeobius halalkaliphilus]RQG93193.1 ArsR family transcriptional regulator [Natrarchaeobius halalkaliphilus]